MTEQYLINNTEQVQPQESNETLFKLYGRSPENPAERVELTITGFDPYCYIDAEVARESETWLLSQDCISGIAYVGAQAFAEDRELAKVRTPKPQDVPTVRELVDETWSADVPFTNRLRIDTGMKAAIEVPESETNTYHWQEISPVEVDDGQPLGDVEPRIMTFDIEVDDRGSGFPAHGEERILSIVAHDNYDDETIGFYDLNGRDPDELFPDGAPDGLDSLAVSETESMMLETFLSWFQEKDPDLITGWNVDGFDVPYIIERIEDRLSASSPLSPLGWSGTKRSGEPRIKGRTVYDMLTVYKQNSWTNLRSYSLDDVAQEELGAEKITFDGSFYDLYHDDPERFLEYNARDVTLVVDINDEAGVIDFRDELRRQVGVDFEDSYYNKDFVEMMCRRKLKELGFVGPTQPAYGEEPESDYEGGFVLDPYEGVTTNVVGVDLASLYPYTMAMLNASPEMKVNREAENAGIPVCQAQNGTQFNLRVDGLFKRLVDDAISLKSEYKQKRNDAETEAEYEKYAQKYAVAKTVTNSLYGVTGWERFFLYDKDVAEAVTLTGQAVIKRTAKYIEESGYEVIYGDTDSCYIKFPDELSRDECLNTAREICLDLNETVYPELAESYGIPRDDNLWEIEPEAYMVRYFQAGKKKRYAYLATWKDGHTVADPEPSISGFSSKRSDSSRLTKQTEQAVLDAILAGEDEDTVRDIVFEAAQKIPRKDPDWELIGIPGGLQKKITGNEERGESDAYYVVSSNGHHPQDAHPRAAHNSNAILGTDIGKGDKPMRVYIEPRDFDGVQHRIDVIAFESPADLSPAQDRLAVNVSRMVDVTIVNPLDEILSALGIDADAAVSGQSQTGLGAFG